MIDSKKFVKALWLDERYCICNENGISGNDEEWEKWKNRKSILTEEDYKEILRIKQYKKKILSAAISPNELKDSVFSENVEKQDWFLLFKNSILQLKNDGFKKNAVDCYILVCNFLEYAESQIRTYIDSKHYKLEESVIDSIMRSLFTNLVELSYKTIVYEINLARVRKELYEQTPEKRYIEYFENMKKVSKIIEYYEKYPVLARLLSISTRDFINNSCIFFDRYFRDYKNVFEKFEITHNAVLKEVKVELGDVHEQGKSVFLVTLSTGEFFLYKPKNLEVAVMYNNFCEWINKKGDNLHIKTYKIMAFKNYTYEEFIEQKACSTKEEIAAYFRNFGKLAAILYYLRGNDFHMENIIASGAYPVVVDLETLLQQKNETKGDDEFFFSHAKKMFSNYIGRTALFPTNNGPNAKLDLSAFSGDVQKIPFDVEVVKNIRTDEIYYDYEVGELPKSKNQPEILGESINGYNYIEEILAGFEEIFDLLITNKRELINIIEMFKNKKIRMLVRSTMNYARTMGMSLHPGALCDALEREKIFENMWHFSVSNKMVHLSEVQDMLVGDIPIFYANTTELDVTDSTGKKIINFFNKTGYDKLVEDTKNLNSSVKERNMSVIRLLTKKYNPLEAAYKDDISVEVICNKNYECQNNRFLLKAKEIGDYLIDIACISKDKKMALYECIVSTNDSWNAGISGASLYDGLAGVELFMRMLYKVTLDEKYNQFVKKISESVRAIGGAPQDYSVVTGEMSWIAVEVMCFDGSRNSYEMIKEGFELILDNSDKIKKYDWVGGVSSILLLAVKMWEKTHKAEMWNIVMKLAQYLIHIIDSSEIIGGFSHGASSLAYVMGKIYGITADQKYYDYCIQLLNLDNGFLNDGGSNWYDGRHKDLQYNCHWCHGALGIGISRMLLKYECGIEIQIINEDLERANKVIMESYLSRDDALCHGNVGKMEYFLEKFLFEGNKEDLIKAEKIASFLLDKSDFQYGQLPQLPSIGMFTGITGIGYELLRLYRYKCVPSVLTM